MASKFGLAGGIPERRVRPIWDAIDSRQYKTALKHCTTLLSKFPKSPYALVLKALILERMGKADEALSLCVNAKDLLYSNDAVMIDDLTLSTLQIVLQRLDHLDMATSCYEYVCGKFPNNMELMIGLFNCYVREYSFVKQQQVAIRMYKVAAEERFLLWAVCSIQLQVFCGNGGEKLLALAEGLLKKHIASHSLHEPEAFIVYISLLEQQSKFGDALEILSGKLGSLIMIEVDRLRLQGKLLARAGDYAAAADVFQQVLELCPDDWEYYLHYLGCLLDDESSLSLVTDGNPARTLKSVAFKILHLPDEVFHTRISRAETFLQKLLEENNSITVRCPYLAKLEIERRKLAYSKGDVSNLVEGLAHYYSRFGHLDCFTSDVETFLEVLDDQAKIILMEKISKECKYTPSPPAKALGLSMTLYRIRSLAGNVFTLSFGDLEALAVQMADTYFKSLTLSKDLDIQENMHGEELLSMTCNVLVQLFWRTRSIGYLLESIVILEFGLTVRRFIYQYKILLVHLYSFWGCLPVAYERYKSLDVKNILMETLSHHILPHMLLSPMWPDVNEILRNYLNFMDDHFRESADLTFLAYRHRNYSKVIEFVQFKERLQRSCQYLVAKVEAPILKLKQNANSIQEEATLESLKCGSPFTELSNEIKNKSLTFNEDLQLRPWWTPTFDKNYLLGPFEGISYCPKEMLAKPAETNALRSIEKRALHPRLIYLSIHCASSSVKEHAESNGSAFDPKLSIELKILLERYANILGFPFEDAIKHVLEVSSCHKPSEALSLDLIDWLNFSVFLNAWNLTSHEIKVADSETSSDHNNSWNAVNTLLKKYILEKVESSGSLLLSPGNDLPILVQMVTEPLSWHCLIIQSYVRSILPSGKKKKKGGPTEQMSLQYRNILDSIQSLCETIGSVTKWINGQVKEPSDTKFETLFSLLSRDSPSEEGPGKIFSMLEKFVSSANKLDLGVRITETLLSWNSSDVIKKLITGQGNVLSEFLTICEMKVKSLQDLKIHL